MADDDHAEFWMKACKHAEERSANQMQTIAELRFAGNELVRVLNDLADYHQLDAISKAVVIATIAKWNRAKTGQ